MDAFGNSVFGCHGKNVDFAAVNNIGQHYNAAYFIAHLVAEAAQCFNVTGAYFLYKYGNAFNIANAGGSVAYLCFGNLAFQLADFLFRCFIIGLQCTDTCAKIIAAAFKAGCCGFNHVFHLAYIVQRAVAGYGFNTAYACACARFGQDFKHANLRGVANMHAAAEFHGEARYGNNAYNAAVFFAEQCNRTAFFGFVNRQFFNGYIFCCQNLVVNNFFNPAQFFFRYRREMREVETQTVRANITACLVYMVAQNLF